VLLLMDQCAVYSDKGVTLKCTPLVLIERHHLHIATGPGHHVLCQTSVLIEGHHLHIATGPGHHVLYQTNVLIERHHLHIATGPGHHVLYQTNVLIERHHLHIATGPGHHVLYQTNVPEVCSALFVARNRQVCSCRRHKKMECLGCHMRSFQRMKIHHASCNQNCFAKCGFSTQHCKCSQH
jgi:hypothetical protein